MKKILPLLGLGWLALTSPEAEAAKWVTPYNFTDLEWQTIETEHFAFHYPKSKEMEGNPHACLAQGGRERPS